MVYFFSIVSFQMSPLIAWIWWCKIVLVAFVSLFSTVHFQMSLVYCLCQTETMRIANQKRWQMKVKVWSTCKFCPLKFQIIIPPKSLFFRPTKIFVLPRQNQSIPSNSIFPILGFGGTTHPLLGKSPENLGSKNLWGIKTSRNGQIWPPHFMWYMFQDITGCLQYK